MFFRRKGISNYLYINSFRRLLLGKCKGILKIEELYTSLILLFEGR